MYKLQPGSKEQISGKTSYKCNSKLALESLIQGKADFKKFNMIVFQDSSVLKRCNAQRLRKGLSRLSTPYTLCIEFMLDQNVIFLFTKAIKSNQVTGIHIKERNKDESSQSRKIERFSPITPNGKHPVQGGKAAPSSKINSFDPEVRHLLRMGAEDFGVSGDEDDNEVQVGTFVDIETDLSILIEKPDLLTELVITKWSFGMTKVDAIIKREGTLTVLELEGPFAPVDQCRLLLRDVFSSGTSRWRKLNKLVILDSWLDLTLATTDDIDVESWVENHTQIIYIDVRAVVTDKAKIRRQLERNIKFREIARAKYHLEKKTEIEYGRGKITFTGSGGAGKTTTKNNLFNEPYEIENYLSTRLADASQAGDISLHEGRGWRLKKTNVKWASTQLKTILDDLDDDVADSDVLQTTTEKLVSAVIDGKGELKGKTNKIFNTMREVEILPTTATLSEYDDMKNQSDSMDATFSIWDLGGQEVFYPMHHLFLTDNSLYIHVVNLARFGKDGQNKQYEIQNLKFWFDTFQLHAPNSTVLVVGSHLDKLYSLRRLKNPVLHEFNQLIKELRRDSPLQIVENTRSGTNLSFFPLSNAFFLVQNPKLPFIRNAIAKVCKGGTKLAETLHLKIQLGWLQFLDYICSLGDCLSLKKIYEESEDFNLQDNIDVILHFFTDVGAILFFDKLEKDTNMVILNPKWLVKAFSKFIFDSETHGPSIKNALEMTHRGQLMEFFDTGIMDWALYLALLKLPEDEGTEEQDEYVSNGKEEFILNLGIHLLIIAEYGYPHYASRKMLIAPVFDALESVKPNDFDIPDSSFYVEFQPNLPLGFFCRVLAYFAHKSTIYESGLPPSIKSNYGDFEINEGWGFSIYLEDSQIRVKMDTDSDAQAHIICDFMQDVLKIIFSSTRGTLNHEIWCVSDIGTASLNDINNAFDRKANKIRDKDQNRVLLKPFHMFHTSREPSSKFDCFLSHCWGAEKGVHFTVVDIYKELDARGVSCWIDEKYMKGNVLHAMAQGLEASNKYVVFLTAELAQKIDYVNLNVTKEFNYIIRMEKQSILVALEEEYLDPTKWTGRLATAFMETSVVIDMTSPEKIEENMEMLVSQIKDKFKMDNIHSLELTGLLSRFWPSLLDFYPPNSVCEFSRMWNVLSIWHNAGSGDN